MFQHPDGTGEGARRGTGGDLGTQGGGIGPARIEPFGSSRRGTQSLPHTSPEGCDPFPATPNPSWLRCPQGIPALCPQGTLLQPHPRQENRSQLPAWLQQGLQELLVLTEKFPKAAEPREVPAQGWATWIREHPMGSTGSLEEPGLNWILLKTKGELWGGDQLFPNSYDKHSIFQSLNIPSFLHPRNSPGTSDSSSAGSSSSFPVPVPQQIPSAPAHPSPPHSRAVPDP